GLAALRLLHAGKDEARTLALRRYILGLALVSFTYNASGYLRQGCLLVANPDRSNDNEFVEVYPRGERKPCGATHDSAVQYASAAAQAFGVGGNRTVSFEREKARVDVADGGDAKVKPKKAGKAK
ncbi:MAG: type I-U CRISPR-associated protein Cas7, partial [Vicinamibacterales bacterium]